MSLAGQFAVAPVPLMDAANAVLVLGRWPTSLRPPYDVLLDAKIIMVAARAVLAVVNC